jgi:hypothetical protein
MSLRITRTQLATTGAALAMAVTGLTAPAASAAVTPTAVSKVQDCPQPAAQDRNHFLGRFKKGAHNIGIRDGVSLDGCLVKGYAEEFDYFRAHCKYQYAGWTWYHIGWGVQGDGVQGWVPSGVVDSPVPADCIR